MALMAEGVLMGFAGDSQGYIPWAGTQWNWKRIAQTLAFGTPVIRISVESGRTATNNSAI